MITENLSTLKIHKLTQEQYDRELAAGNVEETALYLTPDKTDEAISNIELKIGSGNYIVLNEDHYGESLPSSGVVGRIFLKKKVAE